MNCSQFSVPDVWESRKGKNTIGQRLHQNWNPRRTNRLRMIHFRDLLETERRPQEVRSGGLACSVAIVL